MQFAWGGPKIRNAKDKLAAFYGVLVFCCGNCSLAASYRSGVLLKLGNLPRRSFGEGGS